MTANVFAHSVFIVADTVAEIGQEVPVKVAWGHYPAPDGDLIRNADVSWGVYLLRPDGTEIELPQTSVDAEEGQHILTEFTPETDGFYQVLFRRDRGVLRNRQQYELVKTYVRVGRENFESLAEITANGRLEIAARMDTNTLHYSGGFNGILFFNGEPLPNAELILEDANEERTRFETGDSGFFSIDFPSGGTFILMAEHIDYTQDPAIRDSHIVMLHVSDEDLPFICVSAPPSSHPNNRNVTETAPATETITEPATPDYTSTAPQTELPPLFTTTHYLMLIAGGVLLFAAGLLFGLGFAKWKS